MSNDQHLLCHHPAAREEERSIEKSQNASNSVQPALNCSSFLLAHVAAPLANLRAPLSARGRAPNPVTPSQPAKAMAAPGEGRKGREMLGNAGFLYFFLFSALHCCHQVCPGVAASGAAEPSWGGPGAPRKHVRVPPSTAPAFFSMILA